MKKRRTLIIGLLLVAALCLGIGYAGVSTILSINGTAKNEVSEIDVVFKDGGVCKIVDGTTAAIKSASAVGEGGDIDITFHAYGLRNVGDYVTAEFVVINNNEYSVSLSEPHIVSEMTNFDWELIGWETADATLASNGEATFQIKISLATASADEIVETFTVNIDATAGTQNN